MVLIGYATSRLQKVCTIHKEARKKLAQRSADLVIQRLGELAAFASLGHIPVRSPPLHFHPLREDDSGKFVVKLHGGDGTVFTATGDFVSLGDGSPDLSTVTQVEIQFVGNYHSDA